MHLPRLPYNQDRIFSLLVFLTLLLPLAFYWQLSEKFETIKLALWLVLLGIICLNAVILGLRSSAKKTLLFLLAAFIFFGFLSTIFSVDKINSVFGFYPRYTSSFLFYLLWALSLWFFSSALDILRWRFLVKIIFFDAVFISIVGILQSFGIGYYEGLDQAAIARAPGLLGNPNFSAMFLVSILPFVLPLLKDAKSFYAKIYYALGAFFCMWAIINFSSRGAWLALLGALLFVAILLLVINFSKKTLGLFLAGTLLTVLALSSFFQIVRPGSLKSPFITQDTNISLRLSTWDLAVKAISTHPFLGYGPGSLQLYFQKFRGADLSLWSGVFDDAHNVYFQMAATSGLPLALIFIGLIFVAFFYGLKNLKEPNKDLWTAACLGGIVAWVIAASFNPVSSVNFFILIILLSFFYQNNNEKSINFNSVYFKIAGYIFAGAFVVLGIVFLLSERFYYSGLVSYSTSDFKKSQKYLNVAIKLNPYNSFYHLYKAADEIILSPDAIEFKKNLNQIIKLHPQDSNSFVMCANLSYLMYARTSDRAYLKASIKYMFEAITMDKYFAGRYAHAAFYLAEDNQLDLAREFVKTSLAIDEKNISGWMLLARIYQLQNKPEQLKFAVNKALKARPDQPFLQQLNKEVELTKDIQSLKIPALINIFQIEP